MLFPFEINSLQGNTWSSHTFHTHTQTIFLSEPIQTKHFCHHSWMMQLLYLFIHFYADFLDVILFQGQEKAKCTIQVEDVQLQHWAILVTLSTKYTIGTLHCRHFNVEMLHFFTFNIVLSSKNFFCQAQWRPIVRIIQRNEFDNTINNTKLKNHAVTDTHLPTQQYTPHTSSTSWHTHRHITHTPTRKSLASFQIPQRFRFHFI